MVSRNDNPCPVPKRLVVLGGEKDKDRQDDKKESRPIDIHDEVPKPFIDIIGKKNPKILIVTSGATSNPMTYAGNGCCNS